MEVKWNEGRNMKSQGYLLEYRDGCIHLIMEIVCNAVRWREEQSKTRNVVLAQSMLQEKLYVKEKSMHAFIWKVQENLGEHLTRMNERIHAWCLLDFFWKFWGNIYHRIFLWRSTSLRSALHIMNISLWL